MNVYSVKWGSKYNASHVNRLMASVHMNTTHDCQFFCLTDDPTGLHSNITPIPLPTGNTLVKWWNKMYLWDPLVIREEGEKVFFDLDTIVQKNIDPLFEFDPEESLVFLKTYWHDLERMKKDTKHVPHRYTDLNSSVLRWNDRLDSKAIDMYFKTYQKQILWYYRGIDNFFGHRNPVPLKFFPIGWAYSYNNGYIWPHDTEAHVYRELPYVCIFDSMRTNPNDIKPT